ncbi:MULTISPECIES: L-serine ammonia-lyase [Sphingobium]|uniref:L-serine ammonia-lyase n=1 Tax=Sphingobium TaxID=165695 RepID=UPI0005CC5AB1|nr:MULTISPECIES: L-serine ammonia-lyase [Sphingobium]AJR25827.1 serine dehydratase [Sphingobium sp. YBL2]RYM00532.1 L-serine ammonia-lyase [Sphingobium fuliginis]WDA38003.1 L-serine ammonia-lyase [Sphingobium sp. YC-XJ3]
MTKSRINAAAAISVMDLFTIGIGPSSSHTVGPMRAALMFMDSLPAIPARVQCELYGSLALTGRGHATDMAILLGLSGQRPDSVDPDAIADILATIRSERRIRAGSVEDRFVPFEETTDLLFRMGEFLEAHSNGMRFSAWLDGQEEPLVRDYYSVGGGAVLPGAEAIAADAPLGHNVVQPYPFSSGAEMLALGESTGLSIATLVLRNEGAWRAPRETEAFLDSVIDAMSASIDRGLKEEGLLPGGLKVRRRARAIHNRLVLQQNALGPAQIFEWVSLFALAVNEENAAGGRVVTAPTNGAAGVIPAVLHYYRRFVPGADREGERRFLLTAAAMGFLYKKRASISAAEMGCQGEVGVACSMAAAGLAAVLGGTNQQVENAAEIGMEHNLGLTCDPIGGLVQIPCIERNTMGAVKAINAAYLALQGDGRHIVSLDAVIETMRQTGEDMASRYKETSLGGLAVNVVEC